MTAGSRAAAAATVLAAYYWVLALHPFAPQASAADAALDRDIRESRALFDAKRFEDALPPTERLATQLSTQAIYHERHALILRALSRPADEAQAWERMMAASPTPVDACPMIAEAYEKAGDAARAHTALERCASLPPINPDFLLSLGQSFLKSDRKAEARQAFERGLAVDAAYPDLHLLLGVRKFDGGDLAGARVSFERFLQLAPARKDEVEVWLQRTEPKR
jgi:cytochrome c-type biogenesis protein CcmH/NrfG